jgi:hypothetical protein
MFLEVNLPLVMVNFQKVAAMIYITRHKTLKIFSFTSHYQALPGSRYQAKVKRGNYQLVMAGNPGNGL